MVVRKLVVWISICCMDVRNGKGLDFLAFKISLHGLTSQNKIENANHNKNTSCNTKYIIAKKLCVLSFEINFHILGVSILYLLPV